MWIEVVRIFIWINKQALSWFTILLLKSSLVFLPIWLNMSIPSSLNFIIFRRSKTWRSKWPNLSYSPYLNVTLVPFHKIIYISSKSNCFIRLFFVSMSWWWLLCLFNVYWIIIVIDSRRLRRLIREWIMV